MAEGKNERLIKIERLIMGSLADWMELKSAVKFDGNQLQEFFIAIDFDPADLS